MSVLATLLTEDKLTSSWVKFSDSWISIQLTVQLQPIQNYITITSELISNPLSYPTSSSFGSSYTGGHPILETRTYSIMMMREVVIGNVRHCKQRKKNTIHALGNAQLPSSLYSKLKIKELHHNYLQN